jgi:hypothetical protein
MLLYRTRPVNAAERLAARHVPKNSTEIKDAQSSAVVFVYRFENLGREHFGAIAYHGTASKADWHFSFRTVEQRDAKVASFFESIRFSEKAKQDRAAERKAAEHCLNVGDVLVSSWGYDQTNVDFFVVIATPTKKTVVVRACGSETDATRPSASDMAEYVVAVPSKMFGEPLTRRCAKDSIRVDDCRSAWRWDGRPRYHSWYA